MKLGLPVSVMMDGEPERFYSEESKRMSGRLSFCN